MQPTAQLLKKRRFLPLFLVQFLNAFNDNLFKNALVVLMTYRIAATAGVDAKTMVTLASGLFILPFFIFSATAGQLADKYEKARLIRIVKFMEIVVMGIAAGALFMENLTLLMGVLFLLGTVAAFFGPLKYSILPTHLKKDELIGGNGLIEAGTFLAILLGTMTGGLLVMRDSGTEAVSALALLIAALGWAVSFAIPRAPSGDAAIHVEWNIARATINVLRDARAHREVFRIILGISWFWLVGAVFVAQFPTFAKENFHGNAEVVTLFLVVFSIGIVAGSLLCNRLLKGKPSAAYAPRGALGMAVFAMVLVLASTAADTCGMGGAMMFIAQPAPCDLMGAAEFLAHPLHWLALGSLLMIAVCGGIYVVPLYTLMQVRTEPAHRARITAANNIFNALFMVIAALGTLGMVTLGYGITQVFLAVGLLNLPVALLIRKYSVSRES